MIRDALAPLHAYVAEAPTYQPYALGALLLLSLTVCARYLELRDRAGRAGQKAFLTKLSLGASVDEARAASCLAECELLITAFQICCLPCALTTALIGFASERRYEHLGEERAGERGGGERGDARGRSPPRTPPRTLVAAAKRGLETATPPAQFGHPAPTLIALDGQLVTAQHGAYGAQHGAFGAQHGALNGPLVTTTTARSSLPVTGAPPPPPPGPGRRGSPPPSRRGPSHAPETAPSRRGPSHAPETAPEDASVEA